MEGLKKIIQKRKSESSRSITEEEIINMTREYLQVLALKFIFHSKFGSSLSFMGGTCLRICYDLRRYSEDLDFTLDDPQSFYSFSTLISALKKEFELLGYSLTSNVHEEKTVQKAFLSFAGLPSFLGLKTFQKDQKLHIKLEVDVKPVALKKGDRESLFVNRFQEIFPILKHTLPTLFAGKVLAILYRPYARGRDYYDLIWYLSQKIELNLGYLNRGVTGRKFKNISEVLTALREKITEAKPSAILKDIGRFLEDPGEGEWIQRYQELFDQLATLIPSKKSKIKPK